jgi:hypothetical protein
MRIIEISIYFIYEYPLSYPFRIHDGFHPQISMGMDIFAIPSFSHDYDDTSHLCGKLGVDN